MHHIMVSLILGDIIARSIIEIFSDNLLISISSSLKTIKLNLVNNDSNGFVSIKFS